MAAVGTRVSKTEAVRAALAALGNGATPTHIQSWISEEYGLTMTTSHISNTKASILKGGTGKVGRPAGFGGGKIKPAPFSRAMHKGFRGNGGGVGGGGGGKHGMTGKHGGTIIALNDLATLATLTEKYGAPVIQQAAGLTVGG
jgi:hypothetical protein